MDFVQSLGRRRCGEWRIPKLMKLRHRNAPMRYGTSGILLRNLPEGIFRGGVGERMKQRDAAVELLLYARTAGNRKGYRSQFLRRVVVVRFLSA